MLIVFEATPKFPIGERSLIKKIEDGYEDIKEIEPWRWFVVVDGAHRHCVLMHLWYSGYPERRSFEGINVVVINHKKCLLEVLCFLFIASSSLL